ncbi:hypothetical protein NEPAR06_1324 [Nematocida parisii]|uniref:Uncharacterized protein n=1 Tax=Nematocida parisii (strain ERTm3) TaxID=935791 RepID=I3EEB5_NEMP3|nr:uncharacterized protein NEPG_02188 [Nematocida parisii ERTm1]EIJ87562.1 hypothetical protein NEQG_02109 [Nematocida parisii ERTm3]KAI5145010.1 hypothetical protein NEPAR07_1405 [Nematocida parisii]EIJ92789.1 hypothetical protein NEPG_02188 [Nematocida parisii ERTm1]KAI5154716.1 hypothetical protein NEPAR06_1324 [Nematocida parisii]KAI5157654.1 hypothetical protein NEPAR05_1471 [Nematocida parisii]|eukprot:XP_013060015.1 hypothetical protein NEPG_02188 [Nematocida parisii ERTm1]
MDAKNYPELGNVLASTQYIKEFDEIMEKYTDRYRDMSNIYGVRMYIIRDLFNTLIIYFIRITMFRHMPKELYRTIFWGGLLQVYDETLEEQFIGMQYAESLLTMRILRINIYTEIQKMFVAVRNNIYLWMNMVSASSLHQDAYFSIEYIFRNAIILQRQSTWHIAKDVLREFSVFYKERVQLRLDVTAYTLDELYTKKTEHGDRYIEYGMRMLLENKGVLEVFNNRNTLGHSLKSWFYSLITWNSADNEKEIEERKRDIGIIIGMDEHWEEILEAEYNFLSCFSVENIMILFPMTAPLRTPSFKNFRQLERLVKEKGILESFINLENLEKLLTNPFVSNRMKEIISRRILRTIHSLKAVYNDKRQVLIYDMMKDMQTSGKIVKLPKFRPVVCYGIGIKQWAQGIRNMFINIYWIPFYAWFNLKYNEYCGMLMKLSACIWVMNKMANLQVIYYRVYNDLKDKNNSFWSSDIAKNIQTWRIFSYATYRPTITRIRNSSKVNSTIKVIGSTIITITSACSDAVINIMPMG